MKKCNLTGTMHNLQVNEDTLQELLDSVDENMKDVVRKAYKYGHRDARHKATETAIPYESMFDDMLNIVECINEEPLINVYALNVPVFPSEILDKYRRVESGYYDHDV